MRVVEVWMTVALRVSVSAAQPAVADTIRRRLVALTPPSSPWSMTLSTSRGPITPSVTCSPPDPQPRATGISRDPNGTWYPGTHTAVSVARLISRLASSSRMPAAGPRGSPSSCRTVLVVSGPLIKRPLPNECGCHPQPP